MDEDIVLMAHGGGGFVTKKLIEGAILQELLNPFLAELDDAAVVPFQGPEAVISTDSYVIDPIFFPGGDIGKLAVCGTVNDVLMQGGLPGYLTFSLILREGVSLADVRKVLHSVGCAAKENGVLVVTGDTKVIERGGARDSAGMFINTTGIGEKRANVNVSVANASPGDAVIVTGRIAEHGIAIMNAREELGLKGDIRSDVACLRPLIDTLLAEVPTVRSLRDPTRGGLAAALCDIAESSGCGIRIQEKSLPVRAGVRGACDLLGLEPINVANEGKAVVVCGEGDAQRVLDLLHGQSLGKDACRIGTVVGEDSGVVILETRLGGERIVDLPSGHELPRIC